MDRKVVGVVLFGVVAVVTSPTTDENGVVWCSCSLSTICLSVYLSSICLSVCLSIHLPVCLSICPSASLKTKLFCKSSWIFEFDNINRQQVCETSWAFELDNVTTSKTQQLCETSWVFELDNVATSKTQQVCEISWVFELDNVTTSKTQQFCEASSIFEVDNIKTKAIRRDFLQNWKVECRADGLVVPMRFAIFPFHLFKVLRVPWKSEARSYEVLHLSRKIILANLKIRCSKMQPLSGNQRPDPLTFDEHVSCTAPATENASLQILFKCPTPANVFGTATKQSRFAHLWRGAESFAPPTTKTLQRPKMVRACRAFNVFTSKYASRHNGVHVFHPTSQLPKVLREWCVLHILTSGCAPRHNGVHFFHISTSNSAPRMVCFVHFDFEICFAPERRALFPHLNFQQCSENGVLCTFWLRNLLRARTACAFSTSQLPKVLQNGGVFYILTSKCLRATTPCTFSTSQLPSRSAPTLRYFSHVDFEIFFVPQRRAIFHLIWPDGSAPATRDCRGMDAETRWNCIFARGQHTFCQLFAHHAPWHHHHDSYHHH